MPTDGLVLNATYLELSHITGELHVTAEPSTLELFRPNGELLHGIRDHAGTALPARRLAHRKPPPRRGPRVGTTIGPHDELPELAFRNRRDVPARLRQLGPFWLAEAAGPRLTVTVDDGRIRTTARPRRRAGPMRLHIAPSRARGIGIRDGEDVGLMPPR